MTSNFVFDSNNYSDDTAEDILVAALTVDPRFVGALAKGDLLKLQMHQDYDFLSPRISDQFPSGDNEDILFVTKSGYLVWTNEVCAPDPYLVWADGDWRSCSSTDGINWTFEV